MANDLVCVDLSHHNTPDEPDWAAAKRAGLLGVIHKATEGTTFIDKEYAQRREAATAAGLKWASYHFLKHGNVEAQMRHYLDVVMPRRGERVVIDYEDSRCDLNDLRAAIKAIRASDPSLQITVYAGHLLKEQLLGGHDALLATTSLWIAQYTSAKGPAWPSGTWNAWTLWQYSDGSVGGSPRDLPGIDAPHDCNAFNGSRENFLKWMGPLADEAEEVEVEEVVIDIKVPPGIAVRLFINGTEQ